MTALADEPRTFVPVFNPAEESRLRAWFYNAIPEFTLMPEEEAGES